MMTAFGRVRRDVLGNAPDDLGVHLEQVHPAHARLAWQPAVITTTSESAVAS